MNECFSFRFIIIIIINIDLSYWPHNLFFSFLFFTVIHLFVCLFGKIFETTMSVCLDSFLCCSLFIIFFFLGTWFFFRFFITHTHTHNNIIWTQRESSLTRYKRLFRWNWSDCVFISFIFGLRISDCCCMAKVSSCREMFFFFLMILVVYK